MDLEEIKARADAARAPCAAYWLIVFVYLMIHLFPVPHPAQELGYTSNGSIAVATIGDDWITPSTISEIPILPAAPAIWPQTDSSSRNEGQAFEGAFAPVFAFDARGPPRIF